MLIPFPKSVGEAATVALFAPLVVFNRSAALWIDAMQPGGARSREAERMVTEKIAAAMESAAAVNLAVMRIGIDVSLGTMRNGLRIASVASLDGVAAAGLRPYSRRVAANHRRLSR
jgi:hypothetical protein